jgi:hypothetical protein
MARNRSLQVIHYDCGEFVFPEFQNIITPDSLPVCCYVRAIFCILRFAVGLAVATEEPHFN